jgi:hypothetical protein
MTLPQEMANRGTYPEWTKDVFGVALERPNMNYSMMFQDDPEWDHKAHCALLDVELLYVQKLLLDIKERNVSGALAEFGVFEGWWVNYLFEASERIKLYRPVLGYDSFEGLSAPDPSKDEDFWKEGQYAVGQEVVSKNVKQGERDRIILVPGFFADSLLSENARKIDTIAYARIDCDIYDPTRDCLKYLAVRLSHGAVLVFDDWPHDTNVGETLAFAEWLPTVPHLRFQFLFLGTYRHFYLRVWHRDKEAW